MKRLIKVHTIIYIAIMSLSNMYGMLDLGQVSMPIDQSENHSDSVASLTTHTDSNQNQTQDTHEIDLDTVDINGTGNWLEKRIWFEKAQALFDDILVLVNHVVDMRTQFLNEVNLIGHKIDAFYETVDFDKGQLDDKFKDILTSLEFEQKLKGDLTESERNLQNSIKQELNNIDQLGKNIKLIGEVDAKMDQALMQAFKTIDECREYEAKAWSTFKAIGKEIDDKKARSLYYEMHNFQENIEQKSTYLTASLLPYLHNVLVARVESIIEKINKSMMQLKQKGIDLSEIMKKEQEQDIAQFKERQELSNEIAVKKALEEEEEKEKLAQQERQKARDAQEQASWHYQIKAYYRSFVNYVSMTQDTLLKGVSQGYNYSMLVLKSVAQSFSSLILMVYNHMVSMVYDISQSKQTSSVIVPVDSKNKEDLDKEVVADQNVVDDKNHEHHEQQGQSS